MDQVNHYEGGTNHGLGDAYSEHYPEHGHETPQAYYPDSGHPLISGHPDFAGIKKKGERLKDLDDQGGYSIMRSFWNHNSTKRNS